MENSIKNILKYQEFDGLIKAIDDEVKKSEVSQQYLTAKKFLSTVNETLSNLELRAKALVDAHNLASKEIEKLNGTASEFVLSIEDCENEEELTYYKKKLQETMDVLASLENKVNGIDKDMESILKEFNTLRAKNSEMKALRDEMIPKVKDLTDSKKEEKDKLIKERDLLASSINEELLQKYVLKRKDNKFPIVIEAIMQKDSCYCPACGMSLLSSVRSELASGKIIECENCKKLLYAKN